MIVEPCNDVTFNKLQPKSNKSGQGRRLSIQLFLNGTERIGFVLQ